MPGVVDAASHRLVVVPAGGPITGNRIGVPAGAPSGVGLLQIRSGQELSQVAVCAVGIPELPSGHVAVTDELVSAGDFDPSSGSWRFDPISPLAARRIVLELPTELDPANAAREIARAGLAGALLWVPDGDTDVYLPVNGVPHRVREIDLGTQRSGLACLTKKTAVELYASSVRAGVDIVVLADISNSMTVADLPADEEGPRRFGSKDQWLTRIEGLKRALQEMLDIRLQVSGRVSRLALLEFNQQVRHKFPRGGGMAQLDGSSPEELVRDFRQAVDLLRPSGGTDIGNALHEAANLLYQHGRPGNEKLIVLVSDGADWTPSGDQGIGEVVHTVEEPVSLVAHLHSDIGIRLHAIGISTAELFRRCGRYRPNPTIVPNHTLLEELVKVGGGDPTTVGGLDVLAEYFAGLGGGIIHRVRERLTDPVPPGPLPEHTRAAFERLRTAGTIDWDRRREESRRRISDLAKGCNDEANRVYGRLLWRDLQLQRLLSRELGRPVADLKVFVGALANGLHVTVDAPPLAALRELLERLSGTDVEYPALTTLVGAEVDSLACAQVLIMNRVQDVLGELRGALAGTQPATSDRAGSAVETPKTTKSRYTYRD